MPLTPVFLDIWETTWRVPNEPLFVIGLIIVGWGLAAGVLAFTGGPSAGLPEIHPPQRPPDPEPEASDDDADAGAEDGAEDQPSA